jgi:hypothetical protein
VRTVTDDLYLDLLGSPAASGLARTLIAERITRWSFPHILDDVLLIASELIVNAAEAYPNQSLKFRLGRNTTGVFLAVWDASPSLPTTRPLEELTLEALDATEETFDSGGGWGLPLVQALSTSCGVQPDSTGGKWVWATVRA